MTRPAAGLSTPAALIVPVALIALTACFAGCATLPFTPSASSLTAHSQTHPGVQLSGRFDHALYNFGDADTLTIVLIAGPIEQPTQAVTIRMFWRPRAGSTPVSSTATNASIQYIVFTPTADAQIGVYSGAGFFFPTSSPGSSTMRGELWQAHLRLSDRTEAFNDRLGSAVLSGDVAARRDDAAVADLLHRLSALVTQRLGYPRLVRIQP